MAGYDSVPSSATGQFEKFDVHISDEKLEQFKQLIRLTPIGPVTYENQLRDRKYGVSRDWLSNAKKTLEATFDW